jgi:hypothetical protein
VLPNNRSAIAGEMTQWVRQTILEYKKFGFVKRVASIPFCVLPLQLKDTGGKVALIYDMSFLNEFVQQASFKLESWEEMFFYAKTAKCGIKFDLKKYYHEIDIHADFQKYFGFMYRMGNAVDHTYFVWTTVPYGYTRAPFVAKSLMKPLVSHWRRLGAFVVMFYDDGMAVSDNLNFLAKLSLQMQCDLLRAGLVPGVQKCIWKPVPEIDWNGLIDFWKGTMSVQKQRVTKVLESVNFLLTNWQKVSFREIARFVGRVVSMKPVFLDTVQLQTRMLQTIENIRHFDSLQWDQLIVVRYEPLLSAARRT